MGRPAVLLLALLAACQSPSAPPPPPPAPLAPPDAARPADAAGPDAEAFALFDHLASRRVTAPKPAPKLTLPDGMLRPVKLELTSELAPPTLPPDPPPRTVPAPHPAWMQDRFGRLPLTYAEVERDGTSIAVAGDNVILIDADHHPEIGLDLGDLHAATSRELSARFNDEGGDHIADDPTTHVRAAHRAGSIVVLATDNVLHNGVLQALDAGTGAIAWKSRDGYAPADFAIAAGHVFASTQISGHWELVAVALDTGKIDARLRTRSGPYRITIDGDGALTGELDSAAPGFDPDLKRLELHAQVH